MRSIALVALLCACSPSQLQRHSQAQIVVRDELNGIADSVEAQCSRERFRELVREGVSEDGARMRAQRCEAASGIHQSARASWLAWVDLTLRGATGDDFDLARGLILAGQMVDFLTGIRTVLEALDVADLPEVPALLLSLGE